MHKRLAPLAAAPVVDFEARLRAWALRIAPPQGERD